MILALCVKILRLGRIVLQSWQGSDQVFTGGKDLEKWRTLIFLKSKPYLLPAGGSVVVGLSKVHPKATQLLSDSGAALVLEDRRVGAAVLKLLVG
jgi:hypothetical protein